MTWKRLDRSLLDPLVRFLAPMEASCVPFTEKITNGRDLEVPRSREHHHQAGFAEYQSEYKVDSN